MAAENGYNLTRTAPPPPSPTPGGHHHPVVIVLVFLSLGACFFFFTFIAAAICCFIKKRKKKSCHQEVAEVIHVDGHRKVHEAVAGGGGRHGQEAVIVTIEDDVRVDEIVKKKEHRLGHGHGLHGKHEGGNSSSMEVAPSSSFDSNATHHQS